MSTDTSDNVARRTFAVIDIGNSRIAVGRWEDSAVMDTVRVEADDRQGFATAINDEEPVSPRRVLRH